MSFTGAGSFFLQCMGQTTMYAVFPLAGLGLESRNDLCVTSKRSDMRGDKPPGADEAREE